MSNPYKPESTEAMNYEAGMSARSADECPYEKDDSENKKYYSAWMKGFRNNKGIKEQPVPTTLEGWRTIDLEAELMKRKRAELDKLLKQQADINKKIERLKALFGE